MREDHGGSRKSLRGRGSSWRAQKKTDSENERLAAEVVTDAFEQLQIEAYAHVLISFFISFSFLSTISIMNVIFLLLHGLFLSLRALSTSEYTPSHHIRARSWSALVDVCDGVSLLNFLRAGSMFWRCILSKGGFSYPIIASLFYMSSL